MPTLQIIKIDKQNKNNTILSNETTQTFEEFAKQIYTDCFPRDERRVWEDFVSIMENDNRFSLYIIRDEDNYYGIVTVWKFEEFIYIEHFAIKTVFRNKSIGSHVLDLLKQTYSMPIVLEIEPPTDDITTRRKNFYQRNGFLLLDNHYMQPSYHKDSAQVEMKVMTTNNAIPFEKIKQTLYKYVYFQ